MHRRSLLKGAAAGAASLSLGPAFWREALAKPARPGSGPYGSLRSADANGLMLPDDFTSRVVGRSGTPVLGTNYVWHVFPDGTATFPAADGGWVLVCNSEVPAPNGGAGAIKFAADGTIVDAYRILEGTDGNCAGGPTPWGTWLSCEEADTGLVWECNVHEAGQGVARPALGTFSHEAAAVDPERGHVYLTEDDGSSLFYRFTPATPGALTDGVLEAARWETDGSVTWLPVPDPSAEQGTPTRDQVAGATRFRRGEGMWFDRDTAYFTTTSDDRVWAYHCDKNHLEIVYDAAASPTCPCTTQTTSRSTTRAATCSWPRTPTTSSSCSSPGRLAAGASQHHSSASTASRARRSPGRSLIRRAPACTCRHNGVVSVPCPAPA